MLQDLRHAFRQLGKSPGFTFVSLLTLALGIGANSAIFSIANSVVLKPLVYPDSHRLVEVWWHSNAFGTYPLVTGFAAKAWREQAAQFEGVALLHPRVSLNLRTSGPAENVTGAEASANFLSVLRLKPQLGRDFLPSEEQVGGDNRVMLLTHEWWQQRFGSDPAVVGRVLDFGPHRYRVVGVLPRAALLAQDVAFLIPLVLDDFPWRLDPASTWTSVIGRLRPGATPAAAAAELDAIARDAYSRLADRYSFLGVSVFPLRSTWSAALKRTLPLLLGAVGVLLLIACANIANLLLVRAAGRRKEMAVRLALGASTHRILRQSLTESLVLSLLGGLAGLFLALFGIDLLRILLGDQLPPMLQPELDPRVFAFSLALSCVSGLVFGLWPAVAASHTNLNRELTATARGTSTGIRNRAQSVLVAGEIALTVVLLIASGLLLRSFVRALRADPGFDPKQTLTCRLSLAQTGDGAPALLSFLRTLEDRVSSLPGVLSVGFVTYVPTGGDVWAARVGRPGQPADTHIDTAFDYVSPGYFRTMRVPLSRGRNFTADDNRADAPPVVVVSTSLAEALYPGQDPLGRPLRYNNRDWEIIGTVGAVRQYAADATPLPEIYAPHAHNPWSTSLVIRTSNDPGALREPLRNTLASIHPAHAFANFRTLEATFRASLGSRRLTMGIVVAFAVVALGLACLGLYGVVAYAVHLQERDLAIRLALGAEPACLVRQVLHDGLGLGLIGIAIGIGVAAAGTRLIAGLLFEVGVFDPVVFTLAPAFALTVVLLACLLPARHATRVDPMVALRAE
jgi:predicted permease